MDLPPAYHPFKALIEPAQEHPELWRIPVAFGVMICVTIALQTAVYALTALGAGAEAGEQAVAELSGQGEGPRALLVALLGMGFGAVGVVIAVQVLHDRGLATITGALPRALRDMVRVALWVGALYAALAILLPYDPSPQRNDAMSTGLWITLLPLGLAAIFFQVASEELLFRGYLQQQIAVRFRHPAVFMGVPALIFALGHGASAGPNAFLIMLWAGAFGLAAADLTARTGSIGAALGLHLASNAVGLLGLSLSGRFGSLALYNLPLTADDPAVAALMLPEFLSLLCGWLLARLALRV